MTAIAPTDTETVADITVLPTAGRGRSSVDIVALARRLRSWLLALALFCLLVAIKGTNPLAALWDMVYSTADARSLGDVLVRATPFVLAGLAVAIPARAGMVNVGGEGQIIIGAVAAAGVGLAIDQDAPGALVIVLMLLAAAFAGAIWSGIAGLMRTTLKVPEAITTLLLNYVAFDVMLYLIYDAWKDPNGTGQPTSRPLAEDAQLAIIFGNRVHLGIIFAGVAAVGIWLALNRTSWGFRLRVVGGNGEAARRAGLPVNRLMLSAMAAGGALGGVAGMVHFAGAEFSLRQGMMAGFGYIAFLASWLGRHQPLKVVVGSLLLAFLAVGGSSLQIDSDLPAATVNVLMALVLLAVLVNTASRGRARGATT
ncbi:MAG TPA: ABC transporter permease [Acidimicrobiales bacterium]|nr:ABC transporter permease [Acidimicrobiales bacterium]